MKDKTLAGLLALFLGIFGVHRFYLGQQNLGFLYIFLFFLFGISAIIGLIDAIILLSMDQERFDEKYNSGPPISRRKEKPRHPSNKYNQRHHKPNYVDRRNRSSTQSPPPVSRRKNNPFKESGIQKYQDYDFEGAIADFKKALASDSKDVAVHFNLACAYSITEQVTASLHHLDKAVQYGFDDFEKIRNHDALAYLRIQDDFDRFVENGYSLTLKDESSPTKNSAKQEDDGISIDLLEQIKKLGELREKGFLTEEEFVAQKKRLLK